MLWNWGAQRQSQRAWRQLPWWSSSNSSPVLLHPLQNSGCATAGLICSNTKYWIQIPGQTYIQPHSELLCSAHNELSVLALYFIAWGFDQWSVIRHKHFTINRYMLGLNQWIVSGESLENVVINFNLFFPFLFQAIYLIPSQMITFQNGYIQELK